MRALVLSDIHGNIDALRAVEAEVLGGDRGVDQVWVLGDLVDYGPAPGDVVAWVERHADIVVRGNHDHAMATGDDCRSNPLYHDLAMATRTFFRDRLSSSELTYLAGLPLQATVPWLGGDIVLVHATPRNPLFAYVPKHSPDEVWRTALAPAGPPPYALVGHTHEQFTRIVDGTTILNPGSVGLPKDGDPRAAFAIFEDGQVELRRTPYDTGTAAARLATLPIPAELRYQLIHLVRHARLPVDTGQTRPGAGR